MRVIAGKARGTKLAAPDGLETRPTADRIKESLFNMITSDLYDCRFLDLFSGSGGIGIEALSRGAKEAVFVDLSKEALKCIKENIEKTKFRDKSAVLKTSVEAAFNQFKQHHRKFDIIFMDPPYNKDIIDDTIKLIEKYELLASNGVIIVERDSAYKMVAYEGFAIWKEKNYGKTTISFLKGTKNI